MSDYTPEKNKENAFDIKEIAGLLEGFGVDVNSIVTSFDSFKTSYKKIQEINKSLIEAIKIKDFDKAEKLSSWIDEILEKFESLTEFKF